MLLILAASRADGHFADWFSAVDIATGRRRLRKTRLPDTAGVYSIIEFQITPTGHAYFYSYTRLLSQLYLAGGLE